MKRFPAFDPPEYVDWKADPALVRRFRETIEQAPERAALVARLSSDDRIALYAGLLRARLHDIQLQRWVRTGIISKAWLGTGEEASTVGPVHALERGTDIVAPMIRNAAACCELGLSLADMLRAYLGTDDSPSHGRDLHVVARPRHRPPRERLAEGVLRCGVERQSLARIQGRRRGCHIHRRNGRRGRGRRGGRGRHLREVAALAAAERDRQHDR